MKTEIVQEIFEKLQSLGLDPTLGGASDITVNCQLLDAKGGSGNKSITYENAVLVDEKEKAVFLYEKTAEKSKGFSFGSSSESTFQSGKVLSRHVKGVFIGANGVKIDYDFDIGEISKSIKSIAEMHNLKFKTVIRRKSAES
jgi:hypothetical protein